MPLYRAFKKDFATLMTRHSAWPKWRLMRQALDAQHQKIKNDYFTDLKRGAARDEKNPLALIRAILAPTVAARVNAEDPLLHSRLTVLSFARAKTADELLGLADDDLMNMFCDAPKQFPTAPADEEDWLQLGFEGLSRVMQMQRRIDRNVQACADETDVRSAIRWMYAVHGRYLSENPSLPVEPSLRLAERHITIPLENYQAQAIAWWRHNPWTVVTARGRNKPTGVSVMLPVREAAFERVMQGKQMTSECTVADLDTPTSMILVEGCCERPIELGGEPINVTSILYLVQLAQVGALSRCDRLDRRMPIRLLSFGASPLTRKRLQANHFKPTGVVMPHANVELLLRTVRPSFGHAIDYLTLSFVRGVAVDLDSPPEF